MSLARIPSTESLAKQHQVELENGQRFAFGNNWQQFLLHLNESRINDAVESLQHFLGVTHLRGKSFLDIGSGSGLFSLAARRLGARVHSVDFDAESVACAQSLRQRFYPDDPLWAVTVGSVLEPATLPINEQWDVVYSWGVLHHTGALWDAAGNAAAMVAPGGSLFIALYNDQGAPSRAWLRTKLAYNALPPALRWLVLWPCTALLWGKKVLLDTLKGHPLASWRAYSTYGQRGMSPWHDVVDWVGGLPFEVATPEQVMEFHRSRGFVLTRLRTCGGGLGCNQFVFAKTGSVPA